MKDAFDSLVDFLRSSKRTLLPIIITAVITIAINAITSVWLSRTINFHVPSLNIFGSYGANYVERGEGGAS